MINKAILSTTNKGIRCPKGHADVVVFYVADNGKGCADFVAKCNTCCEPFDLNLIIDPVFAEKA